MSPFAVSPAMVVGVFTARWTVPTLLKGTPYVFSALFARPHLIVWAILAGALWAVAELAHLSPTGRRLVVAATMLTIVGAVFISSAAAPQREQASRRAAISRECRRYGLSLEECESAQLGTLHGNSPQTRRPWWDSLIFSAATMLFLWLGLQAQVPPLAMNLRWISALCAVLAVGAIGCGWLLWKRTRFE